MKLKKLLAALFMVLILFAGISPVMAEDPLEPSAIPGTIEGTGTDFAVTDSEYLNVTLQSSVAITVQLESVPSMVVMHLEPVEGATTTQMTIGARTARLAQHRKPRRGRSNNLVFLLPTQKRIEGRQESGP